jgi:hypothetical protein
MWPGAADRCTIVINYRAANRAVSGISTPKNYAASPAFFIYNMRSLKKAVEPRPGFTEARPG